MMRMSRWFCVTLPVVALAFGGWAWAQEPPKKPEGKPEVKAPEKKVEEKEAKDIVQTALDAKFKTLCELLTAAGLEDALKGPGPFTVFAPTDEAFAKLGPALEDLKKPENKEKLAGILKYHVVKGKMVAADVAAAKEPLKTLGKAEITVAAKDGKVVLNDKAHVTKTDIAAKNGVIHVIDTVLTPPAEKKPEPKKDEPKKEEPKKPEPKP